MTPEKQIIYDLQAAGIVVPSGMGRLLQNVISNWYEMS